MPALSKQVSADKHFYFIIIGYLAFSLILSLRLENIKWFVPFMYLGSWMGFSAAVITIYLIGVALVSESPVATFKTNINQFFRDRGSGLILFIYMAIFQGTFTTVKVMMPEFVPFTFDLVLADLDERIHQGPAWEHLRFLNGYTGVVRFLYTPVWIAILTAATLLACFSRPGTLRTQFLWTFILCWIVLGNVFASMFMSVGPIYYEALLGDERFAGLTSHLESVTSSDDPISQIPRTLWTAHVTKTSGMGTGISAFPSLHLSMATLFVLGGFRLGRWLGWAMAIYLCVIMAGSVHLGWHYAIDGYFSIVVTTGLWGAVGLCLSSEKARCGFRRSRECIPI